MKDIALAVVIRNGRVLVQHRRRRQGRVYEFPGGAVDPGETAVAAAVRELVEETGLAGCAPVEVHSAPNELGGLVHFVVLALLTDDEPRVTEPVREQVFHWMRAADIPTASFMRADVEFIHLHLGRILSAMPTPRLLDA